MHQKAKRVTKSKKKRDFNNKMIYNPAAECLQRSKMICFFLPKFSKIWL